MYMPNLVCMHLGMYTNCKPSITVKLYEYVLDLRRDSHRDTRHKNATKQFLTVKLKPIDYIWGCVFYRLSSVILG